MGVPKSRVFRTARAQGGRFSREIGFSISTLRHLTCAPQQLEHHETGANRARIEMNSEDPKALPPAPSRRDLFRQAGAASAAAMVTAPLVPATATVAQPHPAAQLAPVSPPQLEALETLTALEADALEAIAARLIPTDENGPGAAEAGAAHYIDRALAGPLRNFRDAYVAGLAAVDAYALSSKGAIFSKLPPDAQNAVLTDMEKNAATGFTPDAATFFNLVRAHTIQGTFCDPYYGGNQNFVGWELIGYPGIRTAVGEDEQRLKAPAPVRKSAYEDAMFTMKGGDHGHRP
jgi:gluconate 2-dehydrogenase gamma chain